MSTIFKTIAALAAVTLALATASVAGAAAKPLKRGVYDCEAYNIAFGTLSYQGSIKLLSHHRYQGATGRHKAKLIKPSHGKYAVSGKLVHFKGGSYRHAVGHITASGSGGPPHIALYFNGKSSGISCYYVAHP